ncbi:MAG TPA: hypothetical protein VI793_02305 [Anaerolineales bacterium]|nr:hypothetical protein [Anaerolineales bacterium]
MRFRPGRLFRRPGPLRWGPRLFGAGGALGIGPRRKLIEAHRLSAEGQPALAASLYAELAGIAQSLDMPGRAAHMHLQAARSFAAINNGEAALEEGLAALNVLIGAGMAERAALRLPRLVQDMRGWGLSAEAETLERAIQSRLGMSEVGFAEVSAPPSPSDRPHGPLPAKCPGCGGPVRGDEVEWIDAHSAECAYCGSVLQTE